MEYTQSMQDLPEGKGTEMYQYLIQTFYRLMRDMSIQMPQ